MKPKFLKVSLFTIIALFFLAVVYKKRAFLFGILTNTIWFVYTELGNAFESQAILYTKEEIYKNLGLDQPIMLRESHLFPNSLILAELTGKIKRLNTNHAETILDVSGVLSQEFQDGLYNIAFHPKDSLLAIAYTLENEEKTNRFKQTISLIPLTSAGLDLKKEHILYGLPSSLHLGGGLEFDDLGNLYISTGDGKLEDPENRAQNGESLFGKILKIKVSGLNETSIPADNPFKNDPSVLDEIYAIGFRNPYRMSFNQNYDTLIVADVGHFKIEELNLVFAGKNYGWSIKEGSERYKRIEGKTKMENPFFEYTHGLDGYSVTGGIIYSGTKFPQLHNKYIFGDFITGRIWAIDHTKPKPTPELLMIEAGNVSSFFQTKTGDILWTDLYANKIFQLKSI